MLEGPTVVWGTSLATRTMPEDVKQTVPTAAGTMGAKIDATRSANRESDWVRD